MDYKELSKWLWDVAKYVLSAVIISTFLGKFSDNELLLYSIGFVIVALLFTAGAIIQIKLKSK